MTTRRENGGSTPPVRHSIAPLSSAFIGLVASSLDYALVAAERAGTARVASLQTVAGMGFSIAGIMLVYSILMLFLDLRQHAGPDAIGLLRNLTIYIFPSLLVLLMWGGLRDHLGYRYGPTPTFAIADWVALTTLAVTIVATASFGFIPRPQTHGQSHDGVLSRAAAMLAFLSLIGSTGLITFTTADTVIPDAIPTGATVLVAGFSVVTAYCASRYPDASPTPQGTTAAGPNANFEWPGRSGNSPQSTVHTDCFEARQQMDPTTLARRATKIFPQMHLTNVSIIQGVALGIMTVETVRFLKHADPGLFLPSLAQSGLGLVALIIVWYEYTRFTTAGIRWAPTLRDTAIPVLLGVGEIIPSLLLGQHFAWWIAFAGFAAFGAVAFLNTIARLRVEMFPGHPESYARMRRLLYRLATICVGTSATAILVAIFISRHRTDESTVTIVAACAISFAAAVTIIGYGKTTLNTVDADYGLARRPPVFQRLRKGVRREQYRASESSSDFSRTIPQQDVPFPDRTSVLPQEHGTCPDKPPHEG